MFFFAFQQLQRIHNTFSFNLLGAFFNGKMSIELDGTVDETHRSTGR